MEWSFVVIPNKVGMQSFHKNPTAIISEQSECDCCPPKDLSSPLFHRNFVLFNENKVKSWFQHHKTGPVFVSFFAT